MRKDDGLNQYGSEAADPPFERLFAPRSIVVVGATDASGKLGNLFLKRLAQGYRGDLLAVNPRLREIERIRCFPSIHDIPSYEPIDLMLALLPGGKLVETVRTIPKGKVRFLVAIPSGFADMPGAGDALQEELVACSRKAEITVLGPNVVGLMNCEIGLNASMMPLMPPGGAGVSFLTQSGGFGMAMSMYTNDNGLKVAKFCDCGNSAGVQAEQLIGFLADDPATHVIALYLESVRDERMFFHNLEVATRKKPVALCVLGRTSAGQMASQAHLGRRSNMSELVAKLPETVHVAETAQELLDACQALSFQGKATGNRIGIVTGTGGIGSELADLACDAGLEIPSFSGRLRERLAAFVPEYASVANPVDVTPIWQKYPTVYPALIQEINSSDEVDGLLISITDVPTTFPDLANTLVAEGRFGRPAVVYWGSRNADLEPMYRLQMAGIPCFRSTRAAVSALAHLCRAARRA